MGLESTVNWIEDLNPAWPLGSDAPSTLDNHDRHIKTAITNQFTSLGPTAVTATAVELNIMNGVTATTAELNILDGVTKTASEINAAPQLESSAVQTISGTTADFGSIPTWAKQIVISIDGISTTSGSSWQLQLGDSGGLEATGYISSRTQVTGANSCNTATATTYFDIGQTATAATTLTGQITLSLLDSSTNTWCMSGQAAPVASGVPLGGYHLVGSKSLTATLDRLQITTTAAHTFDAGKISIRYIG